MKYPARIIAMAMSMALLGCATMPTAHMSPSAFARQSTVDERLLLAAETSYKAARLLMEAAVDSGRITPGQAAKFFRLNGALNAALVRARIAYDAANAPGYVAALDEIDPLISQLWDMAAQSGGHQHGR